MKSTKNSIIPSQTVIGDYRVVKHFASGGMGDVYEVVNPLLREFFAMKVLREDTQRSNNQAAVQDFIEEARTTVRLRHNNIVTLHTMGIMPDSNRLYFIMDYVGLPRQRYKDVISGRLWFSRMTTNVEDVSSRISLTLEDVLAKQGRIDERIVQTLASDIARALFYAHTFTDGAIVHCDLKPGNILVREDGHAVVTDFGIARAAAAIDATMNGDSDAVRGTPDYMAPEQWDPKAQLTPAVDIYAYGVMICRMLTGTFPIGVWKRPSSMGMNPGWDILIERCIRKDPNERWESMRDIILWILNLPAYARRVARRRRMNIVFKVLTGLGIALVLVGATIFTMVKTRAVVETYQSQWEWESIAAYPRVETLKPDQEGVVVFKSGVTLETPATELPGVTAMVLPASVTTIPEGFFDQFPNLTYITCEDENPVYFSKEGSLYLSSTKAKVYTPPKLYWRMNKTALEAIKQQMMP